MLGIWKKGNIGAKGTSFKGTQGVERELRSGASDQGQMTETSNI